MVHVIAIVELSAGQRQAFLHQFHQIVPKVHAEEGCIEYGPTIDAQTDIDAQSPVGEDTVVVIEKWANVEALKAHMTAPHMLEYRKKVKELVKKTTIHITQPA